MAQFWALQTTIPELLVLDVLLELDPWPLLDALLVLDEVRAGRLPHLFDDSKARRELGHSSGPAIEALTNATRSVLAGHTKLLH